MQLRSIPLCLLGVLGFASATLAEPPSGVYVIEVGGDSRVTLAHGAAEICQVEPQGEICVLTSSSTAAWSSVHGSGSITLSGELEGVLGVQFGGVMRGTTAKPTLKLEISAYGDVSDGSGSVHVEGDGRMKCKLDPTRADRFACKAKMRLCAVVEGRSVDCTRLAFPVALAAEKAPPFHVNLELETDPTGAITGTAVVVVEVGDAPPFGNADSFEFNVKKGKFDPDSDSSKVAFKWAYGEESNKLALKKVVFESGVATSGDMKFNVTGQKGRFQITP